MSIVKNFPPLPTPLEMQQWDNDSIKLGIPEFTLMENAAREALYVLQNLQGPLEGKSVLLFMGAGNNGGDAVTLARHLQDIGARPLVLHTKDLSDYSGTCAAHLQLAQKLNVPFVPITPEIVQGKYINFANFLPPLWQKPHIIVDGLLGTGFCPPLRSVYDKCIKFINDNSNTAFVLALDVPSGYDALNGQVDNVAVKAHATVCFAAAKIGLVLGQAKEYTGKLFIRKIGIPKQVEQENSLSFRLICAKVLQNSLCTKIVNSHKSTWGHVLILGGSRGLSGAAHLAAKAALRTGAGLVSIAAPSLLCTEIKSNSADIMSFDLGGKYAWPEKLPKKFENLLARTQSIVLGPGLGTDSDAVNFVAQILAHKDRPRAIIDADAINILALHKGFLKYLRSEDILTPHPGEAARLLKINSKEVQADRVGALQKIIKLTKTVCILKGADALLLQDGADEQIYVLAHDIMNLAVAGSGDVLSGCAAAFAARKQLDSITAAAFAMTTHAMAGYLAYEQFPMRGNSGADLAELLPKAMANIGDLPQIIF